MDLRRDALEILKETSRTFYIPISRLPLDLQAAVASAYLCMRAIDEIEDHPELANSVKAKLLRSISVSLQGAADGVIPDDFSLEFHSQAVLYFSVPLHREIPDRIVPVNFLRQNKSQESKRENLLQLASIAN